MRRLVLMTAVLLLGATAAGIWSLAGLIGVMAMRKPRPKVIAQQRAS